MRIPQSLDEVRRMSPDEQKQAGEMLGRLMVLSPQQLSQVTKITPEELQGLMPPQGPQEAPVPPGAASAGGNRGPQAQESQQGASGSPQPAQPMPTPGSRDKKAPQAKSGKNQGAYGVLSGLVKDPEGLTIRDTKTGASRSAQPGDQVGPTEVLMAGNQILKAGLRATANLRMQSQKRI